MPEIVLNGNSINIISFFDKMKESYFHERSIKNITDMSSRSSFFNTKAQEFDIEVAEKEIKIKGTGTFIIERKSCALK